MNNNILFPKTKWKPETGRNNKYKIEAIWKSAIYTNKVKGPLPSLYYLVS